MPADQPPPERVPGETPIGYVHSRNFPELLAELSASLFVTAYQAGRLITIRERKGRLSTLVRSFRQSMGLACDGERMALGTRSQVWFFRNAPEIAAQLPPRGLHDACFLPRRAHVTGNIRVHEIAWTGEELVLVNTRFSCLSKLDAEHSFVPIWMPPFVSRLVPEDRCHLNGVCVSGGRPRYVTALGATDHEQGWREDRARGGVLIEIDSGEVVARGLCMPHSPRWHGGRLWLLDSGRGTLALVDPARGKLQTVAQLPGYVRGLAMHANLAFVGLSRIRESSLFGGLPIGDRLGERKCGVWVVDLETGRTAATLEFEQGVEEIFDVQLLPGTRFASVVGLEKQTIESTFVVPTGETEP